jgi:polysaccharide biosynthesis/export protein
MYSGKLDLPYSLFVVKVQQSVGWQSIGASDPATAGGDRGIMTSKHSALMLIVVFGALTACTTASDVSERSIIRMPVDEGVSLSNKDANSSYIVTAGDDLTIRFYFNPQFDEDVRVRPDGRISLSPIGDLDAKGKSPLDLSQEITNAYAQYLAKPQAVVIVRRFANERAFIAGQVLHPGLIDMQSGRQSVLQGIAASGGVIDSATLKQVILVRKLPNATKPLVMELNLINALNGTDPIQDVMLMPNDTVYVPRSGVASLNLALRQYIWNNLNMSTYAGVEATR